MLEGVSKDGAASRLDKAMVSCGIVQQIGGGLEGRACTKLTEKAFLTLATAVFDEYAPQLVTVDGMDEVAGSAAPATLLVKKRQAPPQMR